MSAKTANSKKPASTMQEYGRRMYVAGKVTYADQMSRLTDKILYDSIVVRQSEFKKPYLADDYEQMEYWLPPPSGMTNFDGGEFEFDVPWTIINDDGEIDWPDAYWKFLGCNFYKRLSPNPAEAGDTVIGYLERRDDAIIGVELEGPITLSTSLSDIKKCMKAQSGHGTYPGCVVIAKINDITTGYDEACIIFKTASGATCKSCVDIESCTGVSTDPEWDYSSSATTVARSGIGTVAITGNGSPFYTWSVSGTGFSLSSVTTSGLTNTLSADGTACGIATITVTGCGYSCTGYVRCTTGSWSDCSVALSCDVATSPDSPNCSSPCYFYFDPIHRIKEATCSNVQSVYCSDCCTYASISVTCSDGQEMTYSNTESFTNWYNSRPGTDANLLPDCHNGPYAAPSSWYVKANSVAQKWGC